MLACRGPFFHLPDRTAGALIQLQWGPAVWVYLLFCVVLTSHGASSDESTLREYGHEPLQAWLMQGTEMALYIVLIILSLTWMRFVFGSSVSRVVVLPTILAAICLSILGILSATGAMYSLVYSDSKYFDVPIFVVRAYLLPTTELAIVFAASCILRRVQPGPFGGTLEMRRGRDEECVIYEYSYDSTQRQLRSPSAPPAPVAMLGVDDSGKNDMSVGSEDSERGCTDVRVDRYRVGFKRGQVDTKVDHDTVAYFVL